MINTHRMEGRIQCLAVFISMQLFTPVWSAAVPLVTLPNSAHTKMLVDIVSLLSHPEAALSTGARDDADKTGPCQLTETSTCFNDAVGKFYKSLLTNDFTDTKMAICSLAHDLDTCSSALRRTECLFQETLTFDAITKGSRYFCTLQGYNNYLGLKPCLSNAHVVRQLKECKQRLTLSAKGVDDCGLFDAYVKCAVNATKASCATDIEDTLKESLTVLLRPYRDAICPMSQSEARNTREHPFISRESMLSRSRREAEDFGSFFGGSAFDGLIGGFSPMDLFGGEMSTLTDYPMSGISSSEAASPQESAAPAFSWGQMAAEPSAFSNQEFPWDLLQRLSQQLSGQGAGSSEEVATMPTDFVTQEANSEEVTVSPLDQTTPEISSEEVNTAGPDTTPQADSSEEVTSSSPDTTPQADSSEEVTSSFPDTTPQADSSEEVTTSSPDTTPQGDFSEEVTTSSPDTTPQADSSEEVTTSSPDTTPQADSSEEVSTTSPDTTPQADSSEEVSTPSPDTTPQADSSEEVTTSSPDTTPQADSSEEVSTSSPDTTPQADSSEEVTTSSPDTTPQADSSEEVSTSSPDTTPQADSSEEVSTSSPDTTPHADSSEEVSTSSPDTTPQADSSEEVSTSSPDTTSQEPNSEEVPATTPDTTSTTEANSEEVSSPQPEATTSTHSPATPATEPEIVPTEPELEATTTPESPATTKKPSHVAPFHCYECHSGTVGYWLNPMCPSNGKIHGWAALPVACQGPCVSVVSKYPKGEVYRACSTNYYFNFRVPHEGCIRHNQELYCFCSDDLCNNRNMVADQQAYILTGLITKY